MQKILSINKKDNEEISALKLIRYDYEALVGLLRAQLQGAGINIRPPTENFLRAADLLIRR